MISLPQSEFDVLNNVMNHYHSEILTRRGYCLGDKFGIAKKYGLNVAIESMLEICKEDIERNDGLGFSAFIGHRYFIDFFISKRGATDWNKGRARH